MSKLLDDYQFIFPPLITFAGSRTFQTGPGTVRFIFIWVVNDDGRHSEKILQITINRCNVMQPTSFFFGPQIPCLLLNRVRQWGGEPAP